MSDLSWAAGVFEGEGSIRINVQTKRNNAHLVCDMVNTDIEIVSFFEDRWPAYFRMVRAQGNRRDFYRWRIAAVRAADFLDELLPSLRTARCLEKAHLALEFQAQKVITHENRSAEYKARQRGYYERMAVLNRRGRGA